MRSKYTIATLYYLYSSVTAANAALPVYPAEIIGRHLDMPRLGKIGHVGITTAPNIWQDAFQVIEVLWDTPVVQLNTIVKFKSMSPYWGSRYGISDRGNNALRILREANFQKDLGCATYTTTAVYQPSKGGYDSTGHAKPTYCGYFRCDTFVNYLFHWGNYNLPTYSPPGEVNTLTFPYIVFNAFPYGNGDGPKSITSPKISSTQKATTSINSITAKQIAELSQEEFITVVDVSLDKISNEGANNILILSQDPILNVDSRMFLMDKLGFVGTRDMIPKLIDLYYKLGYEDFAVKNQIIPTIQNIHQRVFTLGEESHEKELLQKFYANLLPQKLTATQEEIVIRGYIALSSNDIIVSNLDVINSILADEEINFHPRIVLSLKIELFNKLYKFESSYTSDIINFLKSNNNAELEGVFNLFIVNRLSNLGPSSLDKGSKNQISAYLDSVKFKYDQQNKEVFEDGISMFSYGQWLEASALVNSNSLPAAARYIANYLQHRITLEQESYIIGLSNSDYLKRAFETESVLKDFKKKHMKLYSDTVGMTKR